MTETPTARQRALAAATTVGEHTRAMMRRVREPLVDLRTALAGEGDIQHGARIPEAGPAIIVANHRHALDARALVAHLPRRAHVVDADRLDEAVRARRVEDPSKRDTWSEALHALRAGDLVVVLPEGVPSPDEALHKGRVGVGWLVLAAQRIGFVPVVPMGLDTRRAEIVVGHPLDFSRHADITPNRTIARGVTDEVMAAIADTAQLRYVDSHTTTAREQKRSAGRRRRDAMRAAAHTRRVRMETAAAERREAAEAERRDLAERSRQAAAEARAQALRAAQRDRSRIDG